MSNKNIIADIINSRKDCNKIAVIEKGKKYSFKKMVSYICALKDILEKLNVKFVMLYLPNSIQFIISYFAVQEVGATVIPLSHLCTCNEVQECYLYCNADLILTDLAGEKKIESLYVNYYILNSNKIVEKTIHNIKNFNSIDVIYRTSGSTNTPKYVGMRSEAISNNVVANVKALNFGKNEVSLVLLSMAFSYCLHAQVLSILYVGGTLIIGSYSILSTTDFYKTISTYRVTNFMISPSLILEYIKRNVEFTLPYLKKIYIGSDYISEENRHKVQQHFSNATIYITYGMTEAGPRISTLKYEMDISLPFSVGVPLDNVEVGIYNNGAIIHNDFNRGEIVLKSTSMMKEYIHNEQLTKKTIQNGWLYTGDFGYLYKNEIFLEGRVKNIVKLNGYLIHPEEIEECILKIEEVQDCIVHLSDNQLVACYVSGKDISFSYLFNYCKNNISSYKIPKKFIRVEKVKKSINGKKMRGDFND